MPPGYFFEENGKEIPEDMITQVMEILNEADDECKKYLYSKKIKGHAKLSVGEVFRRKFFKHLATHRFDSPEAKKVKKALYYWGLRLVNACLFTLFEID